MVDRTKPHWLEKWHGPTPEPTEEQKEKARKEKELLERAVQERIDAGVRADE